MSRRFSQQDAFIDALVGVDFAAQRGEIAAVAGPSGSGKSTLLMVVAAADRADSGTVTVDQVDLGRRSRRQRRSWRRRRLGIVLPRPSDNLTSSKNAVGNLIWAHSLRRPTRPIAVDEAERLMDQVGLAHRLDSSIDQLSGGEQMRLAFACAAVGSPDLIVADEPTASLDRTAASDLIDTMRQMSQSGLTFIVASHDAAVVDAADSIVTLDHGRRTS